MKSLLIIVPGSKTKEPPFLKFLFIKFYNYFRVDKNDDEWTLELSKYISKKSDFDVEIFAWDGGITKTFSLRPSARRLAKLIDEKEDYDQIIIFCKSLGGIVAENAAKLTKKTITKLIYVATPHKRKRIKLSETKIINIYSNEDNYLTLANFIMNFGGTKIIENAQNIEIKGLRHAEFNYNKLISQNGRKVMLFDLYSEAIIQKKINKNPKYSS